MYTPSRLHLTAQRRAVLETVAALSDHPDAAAVYAAARLRQPRIAIGTVYAALHYLVDQGLVAEVRRPDGVVAYDRETAPHDHVICRRCGRLDDVPVGVLHEQIERDYRAVATQTGYVVERHRSEFIGLCPGCQRATTAECYCGQ